MIDLYSTLGIQPDATQDQIKRAFRKKAKSMHPDHGGTTEEFCQLKLAMTVLSDRKRRRHYDRTGEVEDNQNQLDTTTSEALQVIAGLFLNLLLNNSDEYKRINYINIIKDQLRSTNRELNSKRKNQVRTNRICIAVGKRLSKIGGGPDVLKQLLSNRRKDCIDTLLAIDKGLKINEKAQELIQEYSYKSEVSLYQQLGPTQSFTVSLGNINW